MNVEIGTKLICLASMRFPESFKYLPTSVTSGFFLIYHYIFYRSSSFNNYFRIKGSRWLSAGGVPLAVIESSADEVVCSSGAEPMALYVVCGRCSPKGLSLNILDERFDMRSAVEPTRDEARGSTEAALSFISSIAAMSGDRNSSNANPGSAEGSRYRLRFHGSMYKPR